VNHTVELQISRLRLQKQFLVKVFKVELTSLRLAINETCDECWAVLSKHVANCSNICQTLLERICYSPCSEDVLVLHCVCVCVCVCPGAKN